MISLASMLLLVCALFLFSGFLFLILKNIFDFE